MIRRNRTLSTTGRGKPRASGDDPTPITELVGLIIVNPARAGMIRPPYDPGSIIHSKPRASGDDPSRPGIMIFLCA